MKHEADDPEMLNIGAPTETRWDPVPLRPQTHCRAGDIGSAMAAIRDTSLEIASKYLRPREDQLAAAFARLDARTALEQPSGPTASEGDDLAGAGSDDTASTSGEI